MAKVAMDTSALLESPHDADYANMVTTHGTLHIVYIHIWRATVAQFFLVTKLYFQVNIQTKGKTREHNMNGQYMYFFYSFR